MIEHLDYDSRDELMAGIADVVASELRAALSEKGHASLAVPGGTTPAPFFHHLREVDLDWSKVSIMLTDERFVEESSDRSNTRLLRENLLQSKASVANLIPLVAQAERPEDVIDDLVVAVERCLPLDVCVLGMGTDMHTASLFPEADQLALGLSEDGPTMLAMRAPGAPEPRITLSAPVLRAAKHCHVLLTGQGKLDALKTALQDGSVLDAPIRVVLGPKANTKIHFAL